MAVQAPTVQLARTRLWQSATVTASEGVPSLLLPQSTRRLLT